jgi:anti-anti-sigma factor
MLNTPPLDSAISPALSQQPAAVVIDFTDVEFLASAGMGVLVAAHDKAGSDVKISVVAEGPATSRPLKLVGIADIVALYPNLEEALAARDT